MNVSPSLDTTIINVRDTAISAGLALGEVNVLAAVLGLSVALNTVGEFIKTGVFSSDTGEFAESVSSTDIYCTNLKVYNRGQVDGDLGYIGNLHCMNSVHCETVDTDFCKISASPRTLNLETWRGIYLVGNASTGIDSANNVYINQINHQNDIDFKIDDVKIATLSPKDSVFNTVGYACLKMQGNTSHKASTKLCKSCSFKEYKCFF